MATTDALNIVLGALNLEAVYTATIVTIVVVLTKKK